MSYLHTAFLYNLSCFLKDNLRKKDTHTSPFPVLPSTKLSLLACEKSCSCSLSCQTPRDSSQPLPGTVCTTQRVLLSSPEQENQMSALKKCSLLCDPSPFLLPSSNIRNLPQKHKGLDSFKVINSKSREKPDSKSAGLSRPAVCSLLSWNMERGGSAIGGMWKTWLGKQEQKPYEVKGGAWITSALVLKAGLYSQYRRQQKIKCKFHSGGMEEFAPNVQNIMEDIKTERRVWCKASNCPKLVMP